MSINFRNALPTSLLQLIQIDRINTEQLLELLEPRQLVIFFPTRRRRRCKATVSASTATTTSAITSIYDHSGAISFRGPRVGYGCFYGRFDRRRRRWCPIMPVIIVCRRCRLLLSALHVLVGWDRCRLLLFRCLLLLVLFLLWRCYCCCSKCFSGTFYRFKCIERQSFWLLIVQCN